jgi:methionine-rich copper-binding protein CopC
MTKLASFLGIVAVLLSLVAEAFAHAEIESCQPSIDATTNMAPGSIVCITSEAMDPKRSSLRVFDSAGAQVDKRDSRVHDDDPKTISVSLASKVDKGVYTVKWKTLSADDGDEASGEFKFRVGR